MAPPQIWTPHALRIAAPRSRGIRRCDRGRRRAGARSRHVATSGGTLRECEARRAAALVPSDPEIRRVRARADAAALPPESVDRLRWDVRRVLHLWIAGVSAGVRGLLGDGDDLPRALRNRVACRDRDDRAARDMDRAVARGEGTPRGRGREPDPLLRGRSGVSYSALSPVGV